MYQQGPLYLEDLRPGMCFQAPVWQVTEEDIIRFAREFDPQPQHLDPEAAQSTLFGRLAASGWHTAAMVMGMAMRSELQMTGGQIGIGVERLTFSRAVFPGDTLSLEIRVLEVRRSGSRTDSGIIKVHWLCRNQDGECVMEIVPSVLVKARPPANGTP